MPGYETRRFLGAGAYGEVWVAVDQTTGRQVAIKFFLHRSALDRSLLSREVEKLVFLSADRYVVQLLDVGWDAEPPHFVMEYVENGSLDNYLQERGTLGIHEAVELFREVAVGLSHAHSRGILHCDLKPANLLLDQDRRPRLADFGQSRLTHELRPALGTLFYMAPEQADLQAVPDARWDVYALGALLYCMLTGAPPHRADQAVTAIESASALPERLKRYQRLLRTSPAADGHRRIPGVDRGLAEIIDQCLQIDPERRYPHVAHVIQALEQRQRQRARRPFLLLGLVGPLLLTLTMGIFGYRAYQRAVKESRELVIAAALETNQFAAEGAAKNVANEVDRRFRTLDVTANAPVLWQLIETFASDPVVAEQIAELSNPALDQAQLQELRLRFIDSPARQPLQSYVDSLLRDPTLPYAASWFVTGADGTMLAASFQTESRSPVGENYAYRTYFHGGPRDLPTTARPQPLSDTALSAIFRSTATETWKVALSTPILSGERTGGVLAMTVELGEFVQFPTSPDECALLVDARAGDHRGVVLEHPLFAQVLAHDQQLPRRFADYAVDVDELTGGHGATYQDPLAADELGTDYQGDWIFATAPVEFDRIDRDGQTLRFATGLLLIVQKRLASAQQPVERLGHRLLREGQAALVTLLLVTLGLWYFVVQMLRGMSSDAAGANAGDNVSTMHSRETIEQPFPDRR